MVFAWAPAQRPAQTVRVVRVMRRSGLLVLAGVLVLGVLGVAFLAPSAGASVVSPTPTDTSTSTSTAVDSSTAPATVTATTTYTATETVTATATPSTVTSTATVSAEPVAASWGDPMPPRDVVMVVGGALALAMLGFKAMKR